FFFQAEDGIRDRNVTGVQTCALPICQASVLGITHGVFFFADAKEKHAMRYTQYRGLAQVSNWVKLKFAAMNLKKLACWLWKEKRSEERRVGKECRFGRVQRHAIKQIV